MKQVAIVVTNLAGSGAEKIAISQAKLFYEKGHKVVLFLLEDIKTYDISSFDFPVVSLTNKKDTYKFLGKLGDKIYANILQKKMKEFGKFDLVLSNLPRADRVVKLLSHPNKYFVIHTSYKGELANFSKARFQKKQKLYQYIYKDENLITITDAMIQDLDDLDIKYKSVKTIYNPFDFEYIRSKAQESVDIDYDYIISASAFREQKRYDVLLDAFMLLKSDVKLLILAKKDSKLIEMIEQRGLSHRVEILGFQQNPYKYIKNAKLLVLSSDREGLPTVIIESLIVGTPVVSTDCPTGPKDILNGELSKWLVPTGDSKALASKIDEALSTYIQIDDESIERFNKDKIYEQFMKLL